MKYMFGLFLRLSTQQDQLTERLFKTFIILKKNGRFTNIDSKNLIDN